MFFSKIFLPLFTFIGFAYLTSAAPSLFPASIPGTPIVKHTRSELQSRQLSNLLGVLDGLEQDLAPVLANITSLAGNTNDSGALDLSSLLGQLESIIGNVTATLGNIPPLSTVPLPTGTPTTATPDITTIINTFVSLLTSITSILGSLPLSSGLPSSGATSALNTALAALLSALETLVPGITGQIGQSLPASSLNLLGILHLSDVVKGLGLNTLLGGVLGNLLGALGL